MAGKEGGHTPALRPVDIKIKSLETPMAEKIRMWKKAWENTLGGKVEIPQTPEKITPKAEEQFTKLGYYVMPLPKFDFGTRESLKKDGIDKHVKKTCDKYPKLRTIDSLSNEELTSNIPRLPERSFWQDVVDGSTEFPTTYGGWVAIENLPKPNVLEGKKGKKIRGKYDITPTSRVLGLIDRLNNTWENIDQAIETKQTDIISDLSQLAITPKKVGQLSIMDRIMFGNITGIDRQSNILEFTSTQYKDINGRAVYAVGHADSGGSGAVIRVKPDHNSPNIGYRAAIFF